MFVRVCKCCGTQFESEYHNTFYCSLSCQERQRAIRRGKTNCQECNKELKGKSNLFCSMDCNYALKRRDYDRWVEATGFKPREASSHPCEVCGKPVRRSEIKTCSKACLSKFTDLKYEESHQDEILISDVDDDLQYYLLGLIWTDGCLISPSARDNRLSVDLSMCDELEMKRLAEVFKTALYSQQPKMKNASMIYKILFKRKENVEWFQSKGLVARKSKSIGGIEGTEEQKWSFLRGVIDGDGSISCSSKKEYPDSKYRRIAITTASEPMRIWLIEFLSSYDINVSCCKDSRTENTYCISVAKRESVRFIYNKIYTRANFFLGRKRSAFQYDIV